MSLPAPRSLTLHDWATYGVPGFLRARIQGHEPLPRSGPLLVLLNRSSLLDPWLVSMACGRPLRLGAASPLFWLPPLRELASRLNAVPLAPQEIGAGEGFRGYARALEAGHAVALFVDYLAERRSDGLRYTVGTGFLDVLLATMSDRIPVVPVFCQGRGWQLELSEAPLLRALWHTGSRVVSANTGTVVYTDTTVRIGRPIYWRDGRGETTLSGFRREVEDSLGALI